MKTEEKYFDVQIETKAIEEEDKELYCGSFKAIASTYGNIDYADDIIMQGAFKGCIEEIKRTGQMPKGLIQHNRNDIGYKMKDIYESGNQVIIEGKFLNTPKGQALKVEVKSGALDKMSIGFAIGDHKFNEDNIREIQTIKKLYEVSFVTFPANDQASVLEAKTADIRTAEKALRSAGFSRSESKKILSSGFKSLDQCDAEKNEQRDAEKNELKEFLSKLKEIQPCQN